MAELETMLAEVRARAEVADRRACLDPGPEALLAFRSAEHAVAEVVRALEVADAAEPA